MEHMEHKKFSADQLRHMILIEGLTLQAIGDRFGYTRQGVCMIAQRLGLDVDSIRRRRTERKRMATPLVGLAAVAEKKCATLGLPFERIPGRDFRPESRQALISGRRCAMRSLSVHHTMGREYAAIRPGAIPRGTEFVVFFNEGRDLWLVMPRRKPPRASQALPWPARTEWAGAMRATILRTT